MSEAPFGLPVLAELPELAAVLGDLRIADRATLRAVAGVADLLADDEVVRVTGVPVEEWVAIVALQTRMDRRFLLRAARLLDRFATLRSAVERVQISWPQLRGLALALRHAPPELDTRLDAFLAELLPHLDGADPDAIVKRIERAIVEWRAELEPPDEEPSERSIMHVQPRLDRTGGRFSGELDAVGLAIVDDATSPRRDQLDHPGGVGGARADNLLARLTHTCSPTDTGPGTGGRGEVGATDLELIVPAATDPGATDVEATDPPPPTSGPPAPVRLLLRWDLDALLDRTRTPADLLTRLIGGSLQLTAAAARRLLDERGAEVRAVVVDGGEVVGVGRAARMAPGWLREAALAVHDTCTGPLCERPARGADLDHANPWWPAGPGAAGGTTDIRNLGPLCAATNREKERAGWRAEQRADGRRTWTHPRSGLTITSVPATWRPPPARPRAGPSGCDPPT
jgi:hypothetical protein